MPLRRALIVGGGIGGLSAAIALRRAGWEAVIFEQAAELREVGAGLTLWTNAVNILRYLGLERELFSVASPIDRFQVRTWNGTVLAEHDFAALGRRLGAPSVMVHRGDLLRILADAAAGIGIHLNARFVELQQAGDAVTANFADGRREEGQVLIGADGLYSAVRLARFGPEPLRYAGYTCWRGIAHIHEEIIPPGTGFEAWGRGARFAVNACGPGRLFWYATRNAAPSEEDSWRGRQYDVFRQFSSWHDPIPDLIAATDTAAILKNDIFDRPPRRGWSDARVTLLGDAAHPTTPNFGQGACQAMEDAVILADCLRRSEDIPAALKRYEKRRYRRTRSVVQASRRAGAMGQWQYPAACWVRDTLVRSGILQLPTRWQFQRLLRFEPPPER